MKTYGEERNYNLNPFDENIYQGQQPTCAVRSQEIILRDYGIIVPQEELAKFAEANGWYNPDLATGGTPPDCVGNILEACGVEVKHSENNTVFDLVNELSQGHRVIVGVDADELWADTWLEKAAAKFTDIFRQEGNHALIVAGVEVNPNDINDVKVILTDPGKGDLRIEYDIKEFMDAWQDAKCTMVSTTKPAPYQYNADTQEMEFSQFAVNADFASNDNHFTNEFNTADLDFNHYNPMFDDGHLDYINGMSYSDYVHHYLTNPAFLETFFYDNPVTDMSDDIMFNTITPNDIPLL
ncbi:MAG: hypothetical protein LBR26_12190 [Prevotella sp.]|jgi:hypothetical protein|nr:hypothetical protein [Prevotella sp.]